MGVRVEQADGHRDGLRRRDGVDHGRACVLAEGDEHLAPGGDPLDDLEGQRRRDERRGWRVAEVVAVVLDPGLSAEREHVAEPVGGHERERAAPPLDDHVRREGGAVHHAGHRAGRDPGDVEHLAQRLDDADAGILGGRRLLPDGEATVGVEERDVGERPADVDADDGARAAHRVSVCRVRRSASVATWSTALPVASSATA